MVLLIPCPGASFLLSFCTGAVRGDPAALGCEEGCDWPPDRHRGGQSRRVLMCPCRFWMLGRLFLRSQSGPRQVHSPCSSGGQQLALSGSESRSGFLCAVGASKFVMLYRTLTFTRYKCWPAANLRDACHEQVEQPSVVIAVSSAHRRESLEVRGGPMRHLCGVTAAH